MLEVKVCVLCLDILLLLRIISPLIRFASKLLGVSWEVHGTEFLSSDKSCVIVCNHQSILDTLGMFSLSYGDTE